MTDWHTLTAEQAIRQLKSDPDKGLGSVEAEERLLRHGPNRLRSKGGPSPWKILLDQFREAMVLLLLTASLVSWWVGDIKDAIVILALVALNAALGFSQEYRAEKAMEALQKFSVPHVRCLRDGEVAEIEATSLVPGDVFLLDAGAAVPVDGRLIEAPNLKVEEAALTGESAPVEKRADASPAPDASLGDCGNMVYMGTSVSQGRAKAVATVTGMDTELGKIATMLESVQSEPTVLQRRMNRLGKRLALLALGLVGIIFLLGLVRGYEMSIMLLTAITLAVAAVPEGLPAVVTIALALGARRMVQRNALIRRLPAVETLGSVTAICSDKTGTLTENKMTAAVLDAAGRRLDLRGCQTLPEDGSEALKTLLLAGALCNDAKPRKKDQGGNSDLIGDPTDTALAAAAARFGLVKENLETLLPRTAEIPFSSDRKRMTTVHDPDEQARLRFPGLPSQPHVAFCKGAVEGLLEICGGAYTEDGKPWSEEAREKVREIDNELASLGHRVLGVAARGFAELPDTAAPEAVEREFRFLGLVGIQDPARPEAGPAVQKARSAGVRVLMITGDHQSTAQSIAGNLGFDVDGRCALTGRQLQSMTAEQLREAVQEVSIYARVSPEQKLRIVEALQDCGHVVAVTGDGVNDGPALKRADIGIAMGVTGTDVAKEAADAVLLDDNFATIIAAVEEGRTIYDNIRKFVRYLLATNLGELWTMLLGLLAGLPVPLLPLQILWINLVTDGLPALALGVEPAEPDIMRRPPLSPRESIFARGLWQHILWVGLLMGLLCLAVQSLALENALENWQTMVFTTLALAQMAHVLAIRSEKLSLFQQGLLSNKWMIAAVASTLLLQAAVIYHPFLQAVFETKPLSPAQLAVTIGVASVVFVAVELEKAIRRRGSNESGPVSREAAKDAKG